MSLTWITPNKRLLDAVKLINTIPLETYIEILKATTSDTPSEHLLNSLNLSTNDQQILLQSISHIFKKSAKIILKPTTLQKNLSDDLGFENSKAEEFVKVWTALTKEEFGDLDKRKKLDEIAWELNLESRETLIPKARIQFGLSNFDGGNKEFAMVEMNENELTQMYSMLEGIQNKLDSFHK